MYTKYHQFLESKKSFTNFIKSNKFKETYGTYETTNLKLEKELEENFKNYYDKLKIEDDKLIIFKKDIKYECTMLYSDINKKEWNKFLNLIDKDDLYLGENQKDIDDEEFGLEKEPHITILWGIHPLKNKEKVFEWLKNLKPIELEFNKISMFENEKYDVVKIDIKPTEELLKYRKYAIENIENTQTFDGYKPHITISYVKKGTGKKYIRNIEKEKLIFNKVAYSEPDYNKTFFKLKN